MTQTSTSREPNPSLELAQEAVMPACRTFAIAVVAGLVIGTTSTSAAADPDHPRCSSTTLQHRADLPPGYSVRAVQEGMIYPIWCR